MSKDPFRRLQEHLHQHPMGFPAAKSGVEIEVLKKMFEEEEAEIALAVAPKPERPEEIAARLGYAPEVMAEKLDQMARKGLVFRRRKGDQVLFNLEPYVFGICEFQLPRLDKDFLDLSERYALESFGKELWGRDSKTPYFRVIPVQRSLTPEIEVFPYERVTEIIDRADKIAVTDCYCRVSARMRGQWCGRTIQNCMLFSAHAEYYIDNGWPGRMISKEEALDVLKQADEEGLIHNTQNTAADPQVICNCCTCCCGIMGTVKQFNLYGKVGRSDYYARVDEDTCAGCEDCVDRCPFEAISMEDETARVNLERCVGCGLCAAACSTGALSLIRKPDEQIIPPPENLEAMLDRIGKEKGRSMKVTLG